MMKNSSYIEIMFRDVEGYITISVFKISRDYCIV